MHTERVLGSKTPSLFQNENTSKTVDNHDSRMTQSVFTVKSSDVLPPRRVVTKAFYESLKPFFAVMRAMGMCPLCADNKGNDVYCDPATRSKVMEMKCLFCVMFEEKLFHIYGQVALG
jgi:hypothetical protein